MTWLSSFAFRLPWRTTKLFIRVFKIIKTSKQVGELCNCTFHAQPSTPGKACRCRTFPSPIGVLSALYITSFSQKNGEKPKWNPSRLLVLPVNGATCLSHIALICHISVFMLRSWWAAALLLRECAALFGDLSVWLEQKSKVEVRVVVSSGHSDMGNILEPPGGGYSRQWTNIAAVR